MSLSRALDLLSCPRCGSAVTLGSGTVVCRDGHTWDVARQGYVNLLGRAEPANADTTAMLAARSRVLAAGLFDPVAAAIRAALTGRPRVLEVGSGTAYYLLRALGDDDSGVGIALDVSKAAARLAAKADPRIAAVVADVWRRLPIQDHCLDAVLCVFAPRNLAEFARVLRPDGRLVVATPNPEHLSRPAIPARPAAGAAGKGRPGHGGRRGVLRTDRHHQPAPPPGGGRRTGLGPDRDGSERLPPDSPRTCRRRMWRSR